MIRRDEQQQSQAQTIKRLAFTLMEMLVVVAIIVALAGMGGYYFIGQLNESKKDNARVQVQTLSNAVDTYYIRHKEYPQGLEQLTQKVGNSEQILKNADAIKDPWGKNYNYDPGTRVISTTAPDGTAIASH